MTKFRKGDRVYVRDAESWGTVMNMLSRDVQVFLDGRAIAAWWDMDQVDWSDWKNDVDLGARGRAS